MEVEVVDDVADSGFAEGLSVSVLTVGGLLLLDGCCEDFSLDRSSIVFFWMKLVPSLSMSGHN